MNEVKVYSELITWKANKQGLVSIAIRIDYCAKRAATKQIGHKIPSSAWDNAQKLVRSSFQGAELFNQLIENKINQYRMFFLRRQTFGLPITKEIIVNYVAGGKVTDTTP